MLTESLSRERLREYVRYHVVSRYVWYDNDTVIDMVTDEVVTNADMFRAIVELRVLCQRTTPIVVPIQDHRRD